MARYSLFVLKVPSNTSHPCNLLKHMGVVVGIREGSHAKLFQNKSPLAVGHVFAVVKRGSARR